MKRVLSSIRLNLLPVSGVLALGILLAACTKFDDDDNDSNTPVAGLMSFNLVPDKSAIGISLSGNLLTNSPLSYTNYTGTYQRVYSGSREIESFDADSDSSFAKNSFSFEPDKYYSLFVTGANGNYSNVVTRDNFDSLSSTGGKAYLRYINAIPDSTQPTVTITANGTQVVNAPAAYTSVSEFAAADPGNVSIAVKNNANIDASRTISVEQGKVYTLLFVGIPGATDTSRSVQIKFIQNGTLDGGQ